MARSSNIDVRLRMRGARQFNREVEKSAAELEAMGVRGAGAMGRFAQQADKLKNFGRNMTTKVTLPIVAMGALSVKAASDWESSFAGVRKTVDATETEFGLLERGIRDMALQIPVSAGEIAGIAEAAGQLGIQTKNILGFSRVMADLGVATNLTSEDAAMQLAKFAQVTGMSQKNFDRLGSTVVDLGNNFATTERDIVNMSQRLAGGATQVGLTEAEIMGISTAMSSVGIEAEAGGTAMSQSLLAMNSAALSGGENLKKFGEVAGMTGPGFAKAFKDDAGGALVAFTDGLERIKKGGGDAGGTLKDLGLGGARMTRMFLSLAGGGDVLSDAMRTGGKAWKENNALTEEAAERYKTFESQLQIMKNVLTEVGITFGEKVLPHLTKFVEWLGPKLQGAMEWFGGLPKPVQAVAMGFVGLLAAIGPITWVLGGIAGAVGKFLVVGSKLFPVIKGLAWITKVWTVALLTNPVVLIVVGVIALIAVLVLAYKKVGWFRDAVDAAFAWIKTAATNTVDWVKRAVQWVGNAFQNMKRWVTNAVGNILAFIKRRWPLLVGIMFGPIGIATALIVTNFDKIKSAAAAVVGFIKDRFSSLIGFYRSMPGKIASAASGMFNGLKEAFRSALNWIIEKWNNLELRIDPGKIAIPGAPDINLPGLTLGTPDIPLLAAGGTTTRAGLSVVGEEGPELRYMPQSASVIPLKREVIREAVGGSDRPIVVQSILDGRIIAESTARHVANARARA